uniref:Paired domain-containing protein n=1 Tax=Ditylenchus dipsaci TaxID=166011 RepID=A0A915DDM6_9BILA
MASILLPRPYTHVSNSKPTTQQCPAKSPSTREQSDTIGESARNRFGRPYISGRPLLVCDRRRIVQLYQQGVRKIAIARQIGITHSCVSKVIRRFEESGDVENKTGRTASCACPGESVNHDTRNQSIKPQILWFHSLWNEHSQIVVADAYASGPNVMGSQEPFPDYALFSCFQGKLVHKNVNLLAHCLLTTFAVTSIIGAQAMACFPTRPTQMAAPPGIGCPPIVQTLTSTNFPDGVLTFTYDNNNFRTSVVANCSETDPSQMLFAAIVVNQINFLDVAQNFVTFAGTCNTATGQWMFANPPLTLGTIECLLATTANPTIGGGFLG